MTKRYYILFFLTLLLSLPMAAQKKISGIVIDKENNEPIVGAAIHDTSTKKVIAITDIDGRFEANANSGKMLSITYIGYKTVNAKAGKGITYAMTPEINEIGNVVVTAQESKSMATSSIIEKHAMEHLQPSSFADLLELLPGGRAKDPALTSPNTIRIRETGDVSGYSTSSLGTSFIVDGAPISTNANLQSVAGAWDTKTEYRDFVNAGVDMRTIATDDIEKVEIVRGIPSVEYGDLTSGLIKIERKKGSNDINARLKADMSSKLFYAAKGFEWQKKMTTLNMSINYLDAKADPRNRLKNYKRVTLSARFSKAWATKSTSSELTMNADYTGSFDNEKTDPDLNNNAEDSYKSAYNRFALLAKYEMKSRNPHSWFKTLDATLSGSYEKDLIQRTGLVQLSRMTVAATTLTEGESDGVILPYTYTASHDVDGRPANIYGKINAKFQIPSNIISNTMLIGSDFNYDKNYGKGQLFDKERPLYPTTISTRPREYSSIPSEQRLSFYAEEHAKLPFGGWSIEMIAGIRGSMMLNLPSDYAMNGKIYWDPRTNIRLCFPKFSIANKTTFVTLSGGIGQHTKTPTISTIYPELCYLDIAELNYYHSNPDYRRIYLMTYVVNPNNKDIKPARNKKWEISADLNIDGNRLSVTYFRENMTSGFRSQAFYAPYIYKKYDTSTIDGNTLTTQPQLNALTYTVEKELMGYSYTTNGSQTLKEGVEYTMSTKRLKKLMTRLTINGAWFKTTYRNSMVETERPSEVVNGKQIQYVGYYEHDGGSINEALNTNFTFDTDVPKLRLGFSLSAQCMWYTLRQTAECSNYPVYYMDNDGNMQEWTDEDANDTYKRFLIRNYSSSTYIKSRVPFCMNINLKVTKKLFGERLNIALFCNKLLDYTPSYETKYATIRRHVTPYFGLEMNLKL